MNAIVRTDGNITVTDKKFLVTDTLHIPAGPTPALNNGIDAPSALFYNTTDHLVYKYDGEGQWSPIGADSTVTDNLVLVFSDIDEFTSFTPSKEYTKASLVNNLYGGGEFIAENSEDKTVDNGLVFSTGDSGLVWVRNLHNKSVVDLGYYNIKPGDDILAAKGLAINYLDSIGGGKITLGAGTYLAAGSLTLDADNITFEGAGQNATIINSTNTLSPNSGYRYVGWQLASANLIPYIDSNMSVGRGYLDLRVSGDANNLPSGTKIFINGGSSHYDQNYGEFNIVDKVVGTRVYLKYNLNRDYSQGFSSWEGTLTVDFVAPAEGSTGTINYSGDQLSAVNGAISIGNSLYDIVSSTTTTAVVRNVAGKGNATGTILAGTHIFKYRAIILTPTTVYNSTFKDITFNTPSRLQFSNSIKTTLKNISFNMVSPYITGVWLDGDDGRDFTMEDCELHTDIYFKCQFARSFSDIRLYRNKFFNTALEFSEFNSNVEIAFNSINGTYSGLSGESNYSLILLGATCNNISVHDNNISASGLNSVFGTGEIQIFNAVGSRKIEISNNLITCDNVGTVFTGNSFSNIIVAYNTIVGKTNILSTLHPSDYSGSDSRFTSGGQFGFGARLIFNNNTFVGYIDGFISLTSNGEFTNNYINRFGPANAQNECDSWGNILYTHFSPLPTEAENFVFKDNTFKGWNLRSNSFPVSFPLDERVEICNIKFFDMVTTYSGDIVKNFKCNDAVGTTTVTQLLADTTLPLNEIALGSATPDLNSNSNFKYDPTGSNFTINTATPINRITAKGSVDWTYLNSPGEAFTLRNMTFFLYDTVSSSGYRMNSPVNPGFTRYISLDQPNNQIVIHNGNTDGTGGGISRPGVGNFPQLIIFAGATQDNSLAYREGYITFQLGPTGGGLYSHSQMDNTGLILYKGLLQVPSTIITAGTTGNQTINNASGKVNIAAGQSSVTITNNLVTSNSIVILQVEGTDATALSARPTISSGSFIITLNASATAETRVSFVVINK